jgi:hypothetical protein
VPLSGNAADAVGGSARPAAGGGAAGPVGSRPVWVRVGTALLYGHRPGARVPPRRARLPGRRTPGKTSSRRTLGATPGGWLARSHLLMDQLSTTMD